MKLPVAALLALGAAACNAQGPGGNRAAGAAPATISMRPGLWETTVRILSVEAPTAPAEIQTRLRGAVSAAPVSERSCLSPADSADPAAAIRNISARGQPGLTCETGEGVFANGRVRMTLNCTTTNGQPGQRSAMVGSYTAETMQIAVVGESATPATEAMQSFPIRVGSTLTGRRVGDCPAGATN